MKETKKEIFPVPLPLGVKKKLLKIASSLSISAGILAECAITKFVITNWDRVNDRPLRRKPND